MTALASSNKQAPDWLHCLKLYRAVIYTVDVQLL